MSESKNKLTIEQRKFAREIEAEDFRFAEGRWNVDYYKNICIESGEYEFWDYSSSRWSLGEGTPVGWSSGEIHKIDFALMPEEKQEWPEERQDAIGQNGNDGEHYDNVKNPSHYQLLPGVEVIDVRMAILGNMPESVTRAEADHWSRAWEYLTRMWGKNGLEDAKKARVYLDWLIAEMEDDN